MAKPCFVQDKIGCLITKVKLYGTFGSQEFTCKRNYSANLLLPLQKHVQSRPKF